MADKRLTVAETMTKQQEIDFIYDLYRTLPQDSYLKRMLARFPAYAEQQIRDDWGIDPLETIDDNYRDHQKQQKEIDALRRELDQTLNARNVDKDRAETERDHFKQAAKEWQEDAGRQEKRAADLETELNGVRQETRKLEVQVAIERDNIKGLKARLFDYMAKEQAGA